MSFTKGKLILPEEYDPEIARKLESILDALPFLDDMGFDSYTPPRWTGKYPVPVAAHDFDYRAVINVAEYLKRRTYGALHKTNAYKLREEARAYMGASETLSSILHPLCTFGELTLACIYLGLPVEVSKSKQIGTPRHVPIIHIAGLEPRYRPYKGVTP